MIKKILLGLTLIVGGVLVVAAFQAPTYKVERQISIAAPAPLVSDQVSDFRKWQAWSPWEKLDPQMKRTFEGPAAGKGAVYAWTGNSDVGEGRMAVLEDRPGELVRIKLDFIKPFESSCDTLFAFKSDAGKTNVTWTMTGEKNYLSKLMCMFMSMDKMVGGDFEKGLAALKTVSEGAAAGAKLPAKT